MGRRVGKYGVVTGRISGIREHLTFSMPDLHIIWHIGEAHILSSTNAFAFRL